MRIIYYLCDMMEIVLYLGWFVIGAAVIILALGVIAFVILSVISAIIVLIYMIRYGKDWEAQIQKGLEKELAKVNKKIQA